MQSLYCRTALKSADKHAAGQGSPAAAAAVFRQVAPSEFSKNDKLNTFFAIRASAAVILKRCALYMRRANSKRQCHRSQNPFSRSVSNRLRFIALATCAAKTMAQRRFTSQKQIVSMNPDTAAISLRFSVLRSRRYRILHGTIIP